MATESDRSLTEAERLLGLTLNASKVHRELQAELDRGWSLELETAVKKAWAEYVEAARVYGVAWRAYLRSVGLPCSDEPG